MSKVKDTEEDEGTVRRRRAKTLRDAQISHLEKLMENPVCKTSQELSMYPVIYCHTNCSSVQDKPAPIPERPKDWKPKDAPDFVRFYMG